MPSPRRTKIVATGVERTFEPEELFFSTTDPRGVITSGNDVFARISGYELDELVGRAHSVVRHPDMPRAVFRVLWDELQAGRPVAAYVQNLASDGSHYWVLAYAAPIDGGYLSMRMRPATAYFDAARTLYAELRAQERQLEAGGESRPEVALRSRQALVDALQRRGFESYDALMQQALPAEVAQRAEDLAAAERSRAGVAVPVREPRLRAILDACRRMGALLATIARAVADGADLAQDMQAQGADVLRLSDDIELFSLNAQLASARVGRDGAALAQVASLLQVHGAQARPPIEALAERLDAAVELLGSAGDMGFATAVSRLQVALVERFVEGIARSCDAQERARLEHDLAVLVAALQAGVVRLLGVLGRLDDLVLEAADGVRRVDERVRRLRALEVNGRIEAARVPGSVEIEALFESIGEQVREAMTRIDGVALDAPVHRADIAQLERLVGDLVERARVA